MTAKQPAYEELADRLRNRILSGELKPGDRLPVEPDLSAEFGVSRSTVREALRVLSSQNLVATTRGVSGGSFVVTPGVEQISGYLATTFGLLTGAQEISVEELLEARRLVEIPAAGLAAKRRTPQMLKELEATLVEPSEVSAEGLRNAHDRFHTVLVAAAGNPLLEVLVRPIFLVLNERFAREEAPSETWEDVESDHEAILDRVAAGDAAGAEAAAAAHLEHLVGLYRSLDRTSLDQETSDI